MSIDFHGEALAFAKKHDANREATVALIEKAMIEGASILAYATTGKIRQARDSMREQRAVNVPVHYLAPKTIEL